jgi:hypothetical protein
LQLHAADEKRVEDRIASIGVKALIAIESPGNYPQEYPDNNHGDGWTDVGFVGGAAVRVLMLQPAKEPSH